MAVLDRPVLPPRGRAQTEDDEDADRIFPDVFPGERGVPPKDALEAEVAAIIQQFAGQIIDAANERVGTVRVFMLGLFVGAGLAVGAILIGVVVGRL